MGFFKTRRSLAVGGGSVLIGADVNIYRSAANVLKTDDALTVASTLTAQAALTQSGGAVTLGGTTTVTNKLIVPAGTATPTMGTVDGEIRAYTKNNKPYLAMVFGGSSFVMQFPVTTDGTAAFTAGGTP